MNQKYENSLLIFERKVIRKAMETVQVNDQWRNKTNLELEKVTNGQNIIPIIKSERLAW